MYHDLILNVILTTAAILLVVLCLTAAIFVIIGFVGLVKELKNGNWLQ